MKLIKDILKYIAIFTIFVVVLLLLFVLVAKIPTKYAEKNLKEAVSYFKENPHEISRKKIEYKHTWIYPHADQIALNIIYCLDTDKPLASLMEAKYYTRFEYDGSNTKYVNLIEDNLEPNTQYLRYWQGQVLILKPLLMIMTLEQIYMASAILLIILLLVLFAILIKNKYFSIVISMIIGLIMTASWVVPQSFCYAMMYFIMLITSIIAVIIEHKNLGNKKLYILFFITGILTCFFDVLTTEILTILVPVLIVLAMRIKNKKIESFKEQFLFLLKSGVLWFIAYTCMWFVKWILASIVLNINAFDYVKKEAMTRINGSIGVWTTEEVMLKSLKNNFVILIPFYKCIKNNVHLLFTIIIPIITVLLTSDFKDKQKRTFFVLSFIIALVPYGRYLVLSNHSFLHSFFTFRCQLPTIMCVILVLVNCMDIKKMCAEVKIGKKK